MHESVQVKIITAVQFIRNTAFNVYIVEGVCVRLAIRIGGEQTIAHITYAPESGDVAQDLLHQIRRKLETLVWEYCGVCVHRKERVDENSETSKLAVVICC